MQRAEALKPFNSNILYCSWLYYILHNYIFHYNCLYYILIIHHITAGDIIFYLTAGCAGGRGIKTFQQAGHQCYTEHLTLDVIIQQCHRLHCATNKGELVASGGMVAEMKYFKSKSRQRPNGLVPV